MASIARLGHEARQRSSPTPDTRRAAGTRKDQHSWNIHAAFALIFGPYIHAEGRSVCFP
jgi:hypothetical protein